MDAFPEIRTTPPPRPVRRPGPTKPEIAFIVVLVGVVGSFLLCLGVCTLDSDWPPGGKWYIGGTLHKKTALEWQTASPQDKLATCGDFVTGMWQNGDLKPSIANNLSTVDDVRPYAQELVDFLDAAFKPDPDPEENRILYANQTVSYFAATGMVMMDWTE